MTPFLRSRSRRLFCLVGLAVTAIVAFGQQPQQQAPGAQEQKAPSQQEQKLPTFSADVKVVNVLATVRDKHGAIVKDLSQNDFILDEDGRQQNIRYFSRETDLPLTLGLLVDTSLSQRNAIDQERSASATFVDQTLRADKDTAFLIHFDHDVVLLQDLTKSPQKMDEALSKLQVARPQMLNAGGGNTRQDDGSNPNDAGGPSNDSGSQGSGGGYPGGRGGQRQGGQQHRAGTLLYDSVFLAAEDVMQKQQGRKAVIVLSDGVDHGSKETLDAAIRAAQRADTIVYSVYFAGEEGGNRGGYGQPGQGRPGGPWGGHRGGIGFPGGGYPGGGRSPRSDEPKVDGKKILDRISKETGGRMFEVSKKQPIDQIYQHIEDELRNQYNLGYTPDRKAEAGVQYHKIQLITTKKDLVVQARDGYYSTAPTNTPTNTKEPGK